MIVGSDSSTQLYEPMYFTFSGLIALPPLATAAAGLARVRIGVERRPSLRARSGGRLTVFVER